MQRSLKIRAGIVIFVILASIYGLIPTLRAARISDEQRAAAVSDPALKARLDAIDAKAIRKGLDLEGGMYIVLEIDNEGMTDAQARDALDRVVEILRNRVDQFGVSEPDIKPLGNSRIIVQLPGLQDVERAKNLIGSTARLEFRLLRQDSDVQSTIERLDEAFRRSAAVAGGDEEAAAAATPADEVAAVAEADTAGSLDLAPLPMGDVEDEEYVRENPFSAYVIFDPSLRRMMSTSLFVAAENVDKVREMLASPEAHVIPRSMEFQFFKDPRTVGGMTGYPLALVESRASLTGDRLTSARPAPDSDRPGRWQVNLNLDRRGGRVFAKVTGENIGRQLAICLDGRIQLAPSIETKIPAGTMASITGGYTNEDASDIALLLRAGALPVDVRIEEERTVGPSLGADSIRQGVNAALYGMILVVLFILIYYRLAGLVVVLALVVNMIILLAVLAQFGLVLTLPGIAGIILTIGMAVDANVLINERIREELRRDKTARAAVDSGYANATRTIVDANVTTLIAGAILLWFGTGPIQGFAVTLTIGIASSMFTALVLTRVIMETVTRNRANVKLSI